MSNSLRIGANLLFAGEGRGGDIFGTRPDRTWGTPSLLYSGYGVSFPGANGPWCGVDHLTISRAEAEERIKLYFYLHSELHGLL